MPERIYAGYESDGTAWWHERMLLTTEYIRADVAAAQLAERENAVQREVYVERMRADSLRDQLDAERKRIVDAIDAVVGLHPSFDVHLYAQAIKAAVWNDEDEPQEILKRELRSMPK